MNVTDTYIVEVVYDKPDGSTWIAWLDAEAPESTPQAMFCSEPFLSQLRDRCGGKGRVNNVYKGGRWFGWEWSRDFSVGRMPVSTDVHTGWEPDAVTEVRYQIEVVEDGGTVLKRRSNFVTAPLGTPVDELVALRTFRCQLPAAWEFALRSVCHEGECLSFASPWLAPVFSGWLELPDRSENEEWADRALGLMPDPVHATGLSERSCAA